MHDRRRRIRWVNFIIAGIFATFGWFAISNDATGFTMALAKQGLEDVWGSILVGLGAAHFAVAFNNSRMPQVVSRIASNTTLIVFINGASVVVMLWTWIIVTILGGLFTPTVAMCLWLALALAVITLVEAKSSCKIRKALGHGDD